MLYGCGLFAKSTFDSVSSFVNTFSCLVLCLVNSTVYFLFAFFNGVTYGFLAFFYSTLDLVFGTFYSLFAFFYSVTNGFLALLNSTINGVFDLTWNVGELELAHFLNQSSNSSIATNELGDSVTLLFQEGLNSLEVFLCSCGVGILQLVNLGLGLGEELVEFARVICIKCSLQRVSGRVFNHFGFSFFTFSWCGLRSGLILAACESHGNSSHSDKQILFHFFL